ncbi:hypothetical protein [Pontibacter fetidus]|uniref:Lipoprotein n=1 Tax=Pontibacter fetidus TaxID=2700082 RepID=A0A6B2H9T2_9BACT|nr:hypothetical protein [Pontibacter fetidus]NDK57537.1 hypothetical protein [Pontibacter fetidus]
MRQLFLFLLLLPILACSDNSTKTPENDKPAPVTTTSPDTTNTPTTKTIVEKPNIDPSFLIVPGQRIGQISLGQTAEKINNTLGKADSGDAAMGKALSFWYGKGRHKQNYVAVYFSRNFDGGPEDLLARQIRVNSSSFKTPESIAPGSRIASIRQNYTLKPIAYYSNPMQQQIYIYDDTAKGIAFEIATSDSSCVAITIHQKGENVTNSYLPVHPDMVRLKE